MPDDADKRILVFLPNPVGDVVMSTPALRALREHFVGAHIAHVGRKVALEVLSPNRLADETILDFSRLAPRFANFFRLAGRVRKGRYNLGLLMPNSFRAAALARAGGLKRVVGYSRDARGWMLTDRRIPPHDDSGRLKPISAIDYYLELVRLLGVSSPAASSREMFLEVGDADQADADAEIDRASIDRNRPIVMLNPGAAFGPSKMWDADRFAAVADALVERCGAQIIINAAPDERPIAAAVGGAMAHGPAITFADRDNTLGLLKGLLRRCSLLITNDTGARHIAAALGIGLVTLFGSTDRRWAQIDYRRERIVQVDVPCAPCQSKMCVRPAGPTYHQCMNLITPEMVLEAATELLGGAKAKVGISV